MMTKNTPKVTRTWVVTLHSRSAVRIKADKLLNIRASHKSTVPVIGVRIRNQKAVNKDDKATFVSSLVCEAAGEFKTKEDAFEALSNIASPYYQLTSIAANAAIDHVLDFTLFAPPEPKGRKGVYLIHRHSQPRAPAPVVRDIDVNDMAAFFTAINEHRREDRFHRAINHYREALLQIDSLNWVLAAEWLFVSIENITQAIIQRLCREDGLDPDSRAGRKAYAESLGLEPTGLGPFIKKKYIFDDDENTYKDIVEASNAFEHGDKGFEYIKERANRSAEKTFTYVRKTILLESGLDKDSPLFGKKYDHPLGDWKPTLEVKGEYEDSNVGDVFKISPEDVNQKWPEFIGPSLTGVISKVVDNENGDRILSLKINGDGSSIRDGEKVTLSDTTWAVPTDGQGKEINNKLTEFIVNGEDKLNDQK